MTDEKQMVYRALVDSSMLNSRRDIQISGLLRIVEMTLEEHMALYTDQGLSRKEAMKKVAADRGVSKREIYKELL